MRLLALTAALALSACASPSPKPPTAIAAEREIPAATLPLSKQRASARAFADYFADVTDQSVRTKTKSLYAKDAFFNDTLKTVSGNDNIQTYFLKVVKHTNFTRAKVVDVSHSGKNTYVRWVMDVQFKGSKKTVRTIGMTHLRFNQAGQIVFHQDYWDSAAGFYTHLPLVGPAINTVHSFL